MVGNLCIQTQEPIWEWVERQKFFMELGKQPEVIC